MDILWRKMNHKVPKERHNITQILMRTGIILLMGGVAMAVPNLEPFIGLVGAIFFSILGKIFNNFVQISIIFILIKMDIYFVGLLVPAVVQTVFLWPNMGRYNWILIKNIILIIASLCALVAGTIVSVDSIIEMYTAEAD